MGPFLLRRLRRLVAPVTTAICLAGGVAGASAAPADLPPVLDLSFGTNGHALLGDDSVRDVQVTSRGTIVGAAHLCDVSACAFDERGFGIVRLLADGTPDPSFGGGDGRVGRLAGGPTATAFGIAETHGGRLVAVGSTDDAGVVVRVDSRGALDSH